MTCREAIQEVFARHDGILSAEEVIAKVYEDHPGQPWKRSTISAHLVALSVNHPSRRHHPSAWSRGFLYWLGGHRYRRWDPEQDGTWIVDETGVRLAGEPEDGQEIDRLTEEALAEASLSLERDLERCLVGNLQQLEAGLTLYETEGVQGQQLDTGIVGRLDVLALDANGNLVVIELKVGRAEDRVCGQLLRYMGWVERELAEGRPVRGIIVASDFSDGLKYAARAMRNVVLKQYEVRFSFCDAGLV